MGFLAAGLAFATSIINALVYSSDGAKEAAAAGFILLAMVGVSTCEDGKDRSSLTDYRSYGSSTLVQRLKPVTVVTLTRSHYTKNNVAQRATADP